MKKTFILLFDSNHYIKTTILLLLSLLLLTAGIITGITDNLPGISMIFLASCGFITALSYTWKNPFSFFTMAGICLGLIVVLFLGIQVLSLIISTQILNRYNGIIEGTMMLSILFILIPGIIIGISGGIYTAVKE